MSKSIGFPDLRSLSPILFHMLITRFLNTFEYQFDYLVKLDACIAIARDLLGMPAYTRTVVLVLAIVELVLTTHLPHVLRRQVTPLKTASPTSLGTASGGALDPVATRPPRLGPQHAFAGGPDLTINVINSFGSPLSIFYGSNYNVPTPINNPGSGTLSSSTQVLFPSGWAGRITIGKNYDPNGSKIEASFSPPNYVPDVDISYVDGYSVPITCSCSQVAVTGCNGGY